MAQNSRPCMGCGTVIRRTVAVAPIRHYCSIDCRPRCCVEACEKPRHGSLYCSSHHTRWRQTGDPLTPLKRHRNVGTCTVQGCEQPMRKMTWCASHYANWHRTGKHPEPFKYKWATTNVCVVCGATTGQLKRRKHCSARCQALDSRHKGTRPKTAECARCGAEIDLLALTRAGQFRRTDVKLCRKCKTMHSSRWPSPGELAARDGLACGICGHVVDTAAMHPDPMRASVDHVIPRSRGGSDEPDNFQLAHLWCNQVKSDRQGFTLM